MEEGREGSDCRYTLPGILHFLQHEWSRFELERAQWEAEKAELQAKIAFLQGERRGQENLKRDLIRYFYFDQTTRFLETLSNDNYTDALSWKNILRKLD